MKISRRDSLMGFFSGLFGLVFSSPRKAKVGPVPKSPQIEFLPEEGYPAQSVIEYWPESLESWAAKSDAEYNNKNPDILDVPNRAFRMNPETCIDFKFNDKLMMVVSSDGTLHINKIVIHDTPVEKKPAKKNPDVEDLCIRSTGNLGINTPAPTATIQVADYTADKFTWRN